MSIAENRKARFNYAVEDTFEAGLVLTGSEVKALRAGRANIAEAYVGAEGGELWLVNAHVDLLLGTKMGTLGGHEPRRKRKLLMRKREIVKIAGEVQKGGMTAVPLSLYFNGRGLAKLRIGLAKGKKLHDKRETQKQRDWQRQKSRLLRDHG